MIIDLIAVYVMNTLMTSSLYKVSRVYHIPHLYAYSIAAQLYKLTINLRLRLPSGTSASLIVSGSISDR